MEGDRLRLDLALFHIHFVSGEDNGDILADTNQIPY